MHSCSSGIRQAALAMQLATLKFYEHHAVLKCEKGTEIMSKGLGMPFKKSPQLHP